MAQLVYTLLRAVLLYKVATGEFLAARRSLAMASLQDLKVQCSRSGMAVQLHFDQPFTGIVYSTGFYGNYECTYVTPGNTGRTSFSFNVPLSDCGTTRGPGHEDSSEDTVLENTIIIQHDPFIQEIWDQARNIRCVWRRTLQKSIGSKPLSVYKPYTVHVQFNKNAINNLVKIQVGKEETLPTPLTGFIYVGDQTSLVIYLQDPDQRFDATVFACSVNDGHGQRVSLTDKNGCVVEDLATPFYKTRDSRQQELILYTYFKKLRLPASPEFHIICQLEVCHEHCVDTCRNKDTISFSDTAEQSTGYSDHQRRRREAITYNTTNVDMKQNTVVDIIEEDGMEDWKREEKKVHKMLQDHLNTLAQKTFARGLCVHSAAGVAAVAFCIAVMLALGIVAFGLGLKLMSGLKRLKEAEEKLLASSVSMTVRNEGSRNMDRRSRNAQETSKISIFGKTII